ncbi:hypothetical protein CTKA_01319 [Chthonomonas calidirosea]|uniref:DUF4435 domain-containing protein n=1 Tax=Chthonomonas calidirosea (strain DSM 23976 / ICMP 18418 / T49) TaxID=1303518 RepID=S0F060_CHTCT|nr:DUF3226 domain-containing protein [Chthonomonas calidirosea]CCW36558.1 hypothetical protein CCALI_02770 [Chthonomonas calidirosea T49]CEK16976.1 hypothetical protein CTKA_01319 [Chthonomonas calidirosea]
MQRSMSKTEDRKPQEITKRFAILVEGPDDRCFFQAACEHLKLKEVDIVPVGGKDGFAASLKSISNIGNCEKILLVRDADNNANGALQSLQDALRQKKFPFPSKAFEWKTDAGLPHVAIAIMPGPNEDGSLQKGALEDLYITVRMEKDKICKCVDDFLKCCRGKNPSLKITSKSKVSAFLAAQYADLRLGEAIAKDFDWSHEALKPIMQLLEAFSK